LKFFEINVLGVYIAPISLLIVMAWFVTVVLRRVARCPDGHLHARTFGRDLMRLFQTFRGAGLQT
jgi:hypothetical protein